MNITEQDFKDVVITMNRNGPRGSNWSYFLEIYGDGRVVYRDNSTQYSGDKTAKISVDKVKLLVDEFYKIDFFSMENSYFDIYDVGWITLSLTVKGGTKRVECSPGNSAQHKLLWDFADKIEEAIDSTGWVRRKKV